MAADAQKDDSMRTVEGDGVCAAHTRRLDTDVRQARWLQEIEQAYCRLDLALSQQHFDAELTVRSFGDIQLGIIHADPHTVRRTREMIESDCYKDYLLCLISQGTAVVSQSGRTAELHSGSFALLDCAHPFSYRASSEIEQVTVSTSRALLDIRLPPRVLVGLTATAIAGNSGGGALVSHLLHDIAALDSSPELGSAISLSSSTLDMLVTVLVGGQQGLSDRQFFHSQDLIRAKQALERHMHNPDHALSDVANELGMSLRNLQKLFSTHETTPSAWLYQARLERARKYLLTTDLTIAEISERVGFRDVSHFSRTFRQRFELSPGKYRLTVGERQRQAR